MFGVTKWVTWHITSWGRSSATRAGRATSRPTPAQGVTGRDTAALLTVRSGRRAGIGNTANQLEIMESS